MQFLLKYFGAPISSKAHVKSKQMIIPHGGACWNGNV